MIFHAQRRPSGSGVKWPLRRYVRRGWMWFASMLLAWSLAGSNVACASLFADVSGIVHDLQHRPLPAADVVLTARGSALVLRAQVGGQGDFHFAAVHLASTR